MRLQSRVVSIAFALLLAFVVISPGVFGALDVTENSLTLEDERDEQDTGNITVKNTDTTSGLNDIAFSFNQADFSDGTNNISISFSHNGTSFDLGAGGSQVVTITVNIPDDIKLDTYNGIITVNGTNASDSTQIFTDTFTLKVDVRPSDLCEDGRVGDVNIEDIDDPSSGEDFNPLEDIDVRVNIENNADDDLDVEFKAFLIDKEDDDVLEEVTDVADIDEDDDLNFDLSIEVPADIEQESETRYAVYVMASEDGDEEDHCDWERVDIEIQKDNDDVVIDTITTPEDLVCGSTDEVRVRVVNAGSNNQDDVSVKLSISDLNVALTSAKFDLDEEDDSSVPFQITVPKNIAEGVYSGRVEVRDEDNVVFDRGFEGFELSVSCAAAAPPTPKPSAASLSLSQISFSASKGSSVNFVTTITNTGESKSFTLRVNPIGTWTDAFETQLALTQGETKTEIVSLEVKEDGSHSANIEVLSDGKVVATQRISVSTEREEREEREEAVAVPITGGVLAQAISSQLPLVIIIVILAIVIIVLIIWLIVSYSRRSAGSSSSRANEFRRVREGVRRR